MLEIDDRYFEFDPLPSPVQAAAAPAMSVVAQATVPAMPPVISNLEKALSYARLGLYVFPCFEIDQKGKCACLSYGHEPARCSPGKHPRTHDGLKSATIDEQKIREWWTVWPQANIGIATGAISGIFVLDVDPDKGGSESLDALTAEHGSLPHTPEALTGGDGNHYYFQDVPGIKNKVGFRPGLDIRSDGGYVMGPGSNHISGKEYLWEASSEPGAVPFAIAPRWFVDIILPPAAASIAGKSEATAAPISEADRPEAIRRAKAYLAAIPPAIEGQGGDAHTFKTAGHMRSFGLSEADTYDVMAGWNESCVPPWSRDGLMAKIHSAYTNGTPRTPKPVSYEPEEIAIFDGVPVQVFDYTAARSATRAMPAVTVEAGHPIELIETNWSTVTGDVKWLWQDRVPLQSITLVAGIGGLGKSTATIDLAAQVSRGGTFPDGSAAPIGDVIIFSAEDPDAIIKSRLERQGADLSRIHKVDGRKVGTVQTFFDLRDIHTLETAIKKYPNTNLIIIDPVASYATGIDSHKNADVRVVCAPLAKFAERHGIAVLLVAHFNKATNAGPENRISGSTAWRDLARAVYHVIEDPADATRRLWLPDKASYAHKGCGFVFSIGEDASLKWHGETHLTTADVMATKGQEPTQTGLAEAWLRLLLQGGPVPAAKVLAEAKKIDIGERPLRDAKTSLGVKVSREGFGGGGVWQWALPADFEP